MHILKDTHFDGRRLFDLRVVHGLPLDMAIDRIVTDSRMLVDWECFVIRARECGWWDFPTYKVMKHALEDSGVCRDYAKSVIEWFKRFVVTNEHPAMIGTKNGR